MALKHNPSTVAEKALNPIGVHHLADNNYEVQRTNNFELIVTGISTAAQEALRLSVSSAFIPHFSQSVIEVKRGNGVMKFAGVPTFEAGQATFNDFIDLATKDVLQEWQKLSYNVETEKVGLTDDYKKDCFVVQYSPDYQVVRKWKIHGMWISSISEDAPSADNNNAVKVTVTFNYDWGEIYTKDIA